MSQQIIIINLLEKLKDVDSDYRFMAFNDLIQEISKGLYLDDQLENRLVESIIKSLDDNNLEVKQQSIKCIGSIINKLRYKQFQLIIDKLINYNKQSNNDELKDISSLGLKTIINELNNKNSSLAFIIIDKLIPNILDLIQVDSDNQLTLDYLEILNEIILKFSSNFNDELTDVVFNKLIQLLLKSKRLTIKKRSISTLSSLLLKFNNVEINNALVEFISTNIKSNLNIIIQLVNSILNSSPQVLDNSNFIQFIIPIILDSIDNDDDELREISFNCLESFITKLNVSNYNDKFIELSLNFVKYNPNYVEMDEDDDENTFDDDDDIDQFSDDDDFSWKVRKSCAKLISSLILNNQNDLTKFYKSLFPSLINSLNIEREESVKLELFNTISSFLTITYKFSYEFRAPLKRKHIENDDEEMETDEQNPSTILKSQSNNLIMVVIKNLNDKSLQTRLYGFKVLNNFIKTIPEILSNHIDSLTPLIQLSLSEIQSTASSGLPIEILQFLNSFFSTHHYKSISSSLSSLISIIIDTTKLSKYHKISSLALITLSQSVKLIRPLKSDGRGSPLSSDYVIQLLDSIKVATIDRISDTDLSQDVKENAINVLAVLLSHAGDIVTINNDDRCVKLLSSRLNNDVTRLVSVKAINSAAKSRICNSQLFQNWFLECTKNVAPLLRQNDRTLRMNAFECLESLLDNVSSIIDIKLANDLLNDISPFISVAELYSLSNTLNISSTLMNSSDEIKDLVKLEILPKTYDIVQSPSLVVGSHGMDSLITFYSLVVQSDKQISNQIVSSLLKSIENVELCSVGGSGTGSEGSHVFSTVSNLLGVVVTTSGLQNTKQFIDYFVQTIENKKSNVSQLFLSLLSVGEIGRST